jgi:hypothetical protein
VASVEEVVAVEEGFPVAVEEAVVAAVAVGGRHEDMPRISTRTFGGEDKDVAKNE